MGVFENAWERGNHPLPAKEENELKMNSLGIVSLLHALRSNVVGDSPKGKLSSNIFEILLDLTEDEKVSFD